MHRGHRQSTEEELAEVTMVVRAIVTEVTAEMAAPLALRIEALERRRPPAEPAIGRRRIGPDS